MSSVEALADPRNFARRTMDINRTAPRAAALIHDAFAAYHERFLAVTRRAVTRFAERDWHGAQQDATERLALYKAQVERTLDAMRALLGPAAAHPDTWEGIKWLHSALIAERDDCEIAETFFNSITRRIFHTVGVNPRIEYVLSAASLGERGDERPITTVYPRRGDTVELVRAILHDLPWPGPYRDRDGDAALVAARIDDAVRVVWGDGGFDGAEVLSSLFYRNKGAYLVGRLRYGERFLPLLLPILHDERGIAVDAVLLTSDEASIVFGFSWSYFRVDVARPRAVVDFLRSIMPLKRIDELYTAIGYNKHGKTELFRSLMEHMESADAQFDFVEGQAGLVMSVFALGGLNVVFKVIRDEFGYPKRTTRRAVMDRYHLVFVRDRVGRLADAQEFEHLEFRAACFAPSLLDHLRAAAGSVVQLEGDRVIIRHLYTERRVTPLDLYLRDAGEVAACDAIVDYGYAIKDLAAANIFTGDMLLKNFGVSRHGRVIFYDYDELCLLTDCRFRRIPTPASPEEELAAEPWYYVGEQDVFPEEFRAFLVPSGALRERFLAAHADLLDVGFWSAMQARHRDGSNDLADVFPYRPERRLRSTGAG